MKNTLTSSLVFIQYVLWPLWSASPNYPLQFLVHEDWSDLRKAVIQDISSHTNWTERCIWPPLPTGIAWSSEVKKGFWSQDHSGGCQGWVILLCEWDLASPSARAALLARNTSPYATATELVVTEGAFKWFRETWKMPQLGDCRFLMQIFFICPPTLGGIWF